LLSLRIITNPALVTNANPGQEGCIVRGDLMKLLTDVDTLLFLISCHNFGHRYGGDTMHAQSSSQNPLANPITNPGLISKVLDGSASVLMNELLKFGYSVWWCGPDGPTCVVVSIGHLVLNQACHSGTYARLVLSSPHALKRNGFQES
jgi:hypothetical protein